MQRFPVIFSRSMGGKKKIKIKIKMEEIRARDCPRDASGRNDSENP